MVSFRERDGNTDRGALGAVGQGLHLDTRGVLVDDGVERLIVVVIPDDVAVLLIPHDVRQVHLSIGGPDGVVEAHPERADILRRVISCRHI
ncbi:hypothetical protein CN359_30475 [Bacillus thuringiensis]|nr:hypothetical protein CN359_30475 [Bacillus thuringiensis]